ncbi:NAD(P)-dependent oxidoreductase [Verrucomicrobium sp. BvORR106]|uniref:NAD-dependent epimerase/dehydratase family protein n=1 Tax=Verrucomicrobium sp. BvORR106 TaxID=1403819 RepID=UPI00056F00B1|nr:NAD(P)-dependent oxidoreductase [Verrucomicrobium sp. BvORR106]
MKLFVTGATGFIGQAFCRIAAERGHQVLGLSRNVHRPPGGAYELVGGSLDHVPWDRVADFAPEALVHLAWLVKPGSVNSPENELLVAQSANLFEGAVEAGVTHIAGTGTCIEYAPSNERLDEETSALGPETAYSRAKLATLDLLKALGSARQISWSWYRIFYVYGAGEHPDRLSASILRHLSQRKDVVLRTPLSVKDYIHVDDVASALIWGLERNMTGPINVGSGQGIRIVDFARAAAEIVGAEAGHIKEVDPPAADPFPVTVADISRLRASGWVPQVSLHQGLSGMAAML